MSKDSKSKKSTARLTTPVDHHVGTRIREARLGLDMSQTDLANACSITFQQIQKYEHGTNRVSASRMWQFAAVLLKPIDWFFDGLPKHKLSATVEKSLDRKRRGAIERNEGTAIDSDTQKLARAIAGLKDEALKKRLKTMLSTLSAA